MLTVPHSAMTSMNKSQVSLSLINDPPPSPRSFRPLDAGRRGERRVLRRPGRRGHHRCHRVRGLPRPAGDPPEEAEPRQGPHQLLEKQRRV